MSEIKGILDNTTQEVLVLNDDRILVRGNLKVAGVLDVGLVRTTEIIADHRYEKKFLVFVAPDGTDIAGTGLLWQDKVQNKQLVYRNAPESFFLSEHVDIPNDKAYMIGGTPLLTFDKLGPSVVESNLRSVGTLKTLTVDGTVNFGDFTFFNPRRVSIGKEESSSLFTVYDELTDVEIILDGGQDSRAKIGTANNRGVDIVAGGGAKVSINVSGNVIIGQESRTDATINVYGKLGINVANPKESLEVSGNIKFSEKLFTVGNQVPTEGVWSRGDIIWNNDPMAGNYIGWVCTMGGNPGLWSPFGLIAG